MLELLDFWWKPLGFLAVVVFILWYTVRENNKPEVQAQVNKANWEQAHAYAPCQQPISKELELERLSGYMDEIASIKRQETIHDACEGHALCDLISRIEYDYRNLRN